MPGLDGAAAVKPPAYEKVRSGGVEWWIDRAWAHLVRDGILADIDRPRARTSVLKSRKAKKHVEVEDAESGERFIVKTYRESAPLRRLKAAVRGGRASRELEAFRRAAERGIPCAPILAAGVRRGRSFVVVRRLAGWERVDRAYRALGARDPKRTRLADAYGMFCRRIHDAGVTQYDLNPTNALVRFERERPQLLMIDFERLEFGEGVPLAIRLESLGRMDRIRGVSRTDRLRFLAGYCGEDWGVWRKWSQQIAGHRERSLKGQARKIAKACGRESRNFGRFAHENLCGFYRKPDPETHGGGIDVEVLRALAVEPEPARPGLRLMHSPQARKMWVEECVRYQLGRSARPPLAVLWIRGRRQGFLIYGAAP